MNSQHINIAYQYFSKLITLNPHEQKLLESITEIVNVGKNEFVLNEGQISRYDFFVLKGCLRSFYMDENLKEHTTMFAIEGWWTGELKSYYQGTASNIGIQATEDSVILRLTKQNKDLLLAQLPQFEKYFRILFQNRLIANEHRIANHLSSTAALGYAEFRIKYPNLEQRVPQKYIASYLGITPTYLSRLKKKRLI